MSLVRKLASLVPKRYYVPIRYLYHQTTGTLERELLLLEDLLVTRKTAIDIGANWGCYSYRLAKTCSQVEAFEPIDECADAIRRYRARNIRVHSVALSSARGQRELYLPLRGGNPTRGLASFDRPPSPAEVRIVQVHRLDDYEFRDVSFLKIDVEGHELEVLEGAARTIERERPVMLIEIEQRHLTVPMEGVFDRIVGYGYRGFFLAGGSLLPLSSFSCAEHQRQPTGDPVPRLPGYVNNFIFRPDPVGVSAARRLAGGIL